MKGRTQYYSTKCKGVNYPDNCLSLIMDAMDQRKTSVPFFSETTKDCEQSFYALYPTKKNNWEMNLLLKKMKLARLLAQLLTKTYFPNKSSANIL